MENNELQTLRHSASHILAQAVKRLFPGTKLAIGPAIENGFYYDFDSETSFTPETLEQLEEEMKKICRQTPRYLFTGRASSPTFAPALTLHIQKK